MNSIHTITDYQTRSTGTTPVLSGFPSLDSAHEVIFRPTQLSATRQGFSVQTAEEKHHSPSPEGPSTFTRVALSAVAAGLSSAATTYSHAVIYREMFTRPRSAHSTGARSEQPIEIVEPSTRTGSEALNDQHSAVAAGNETESSDPASISSVPNSNPDQNTEPSQGDTGSLEDVSSSIAPSQSNDSAEKMDATQQNANQHDQTLAPTNCTSPTTETHQKPVARGDIEVRIRSRGTDIGSGATEYSASYDRQQEHTRDLGVQFFNQGRESSFMSVGSAQSLLDLEPGAKNRKLAALEHRRLGFGGHVLFDIRNTASGQTFTLPLPVDHGIMIDNYACFHSKWISDNIVGMRDSILKITPN